MFITNNGSVSQIKLDFLVCILHFWYRIGCAYLSSINAGNLIGSTWVVFEAAFVIFFEVLFQLVFGLLCLRPF